MFFQKPYILRKLAKKYLFLKKKIETRYSYPAFKKDIKDFFTQARRIVTSIKKKTFIKKTAQYLKAYVTQYRSCRCQNIKLIRTKYVACIFS